MDDMTLAGLGRQFASYAATIEQLVRQNEALKAELERLKAASPPEA